MVEPSANPPEACYYAPSLVSSPPDGVEGTFVKGVIRINPKAHQDAYINDPAGGPNIYLEGSESRKNTLEGDLVKVMLNPPNQWKQLAESRVQKTGQVVEILHRTHRGVAGGTLRRYSHKFALFSPTDSRIPRMLIDIDQCPSDFSTAPGRYAESMFVATLYRWDPGEIYARGNLTSVIGDCNKIETRMTALLMEHQVHDFDFPPEVYAELDYLNYLPTNWLEQSGQNRRDLTRECIFTIDPKTARDLDDALSVKQIAEQIYEVGVHIADVSYFVTEGSMVDLCARERTTSVYLVDRVIPMLPAVLCEQLCSLNAGEKKFTFSVMWKMDKFGRIIDTWFGRTIIKPCVKLAYEQAQDMIDSDGDVSWIQEDSNMPKLHAFDWKRIAKSVTLLNKIATRLRRKRFEGGALKIEQRKLKFELDPESGIPTGFSFEKRTAANFLVEEFMLLANISVAERIYAFNNQMAFLRRHPPSDGQILKEVKEFCDAKGIALNISSAGSLQKSINAITDPQMSKVISFLLLRAMKNAEYICAGAEESHTFRHFALNVPLYTHFTSPIRRYPDIIVHRQLAMSLDYAQFTYDTTESLAYIADECTKRKISSKLISDTSQKWYFNLFVLKAGFCELHACVTRIYDHSFDVILIDYDRTGRVYLDKGSQPNIQELKFENVDGVRSLILLWRTASKRSKKNRAKKLGRLTQKNPDESQGARSSLEAKRVEQTGRNDYTVNEQVNNRQVIEVFDIIKVIVKADAKNITNLRIDLKEPE